MISCSARTSATGLTLALLACYTSKRRRVFWVRKNPNDGLASASSYSPFYFLHCRVMSDQWK